MDELHAGIKIARRNINHLKYAYGTTLMAEIEEKLKNLLMKVKEESKNSWLKTQHYKKKEKKGKYHGIWSVANRRVKSGNNDRFYLFSWAPKSLQTVTAAIKLKDVCPLEEKL